MFKLTCGWAPPSLCPLDVAHVINAPWPSPFATLPLPQTEEQKQGRPGNEAVVFTVSSCGGGSLDFIAAITQDHYYQVSHG